MESPGRVANNLFSKRYKDASCFSLPTLPPPFPSLPPSPPSLPQSDKDDIDKPRAYPSYEELLRESELDLGMPVIPPSLLIFGILLSNLSTPSFYIQIIHILPPLCSLSLPLPLFVSLLFFQCSPIPTIIIIIPPCSSLSLHSHVLQRARTL